MRTFADPRWALHKGGRVFAILLVCAATVSAQTAAPGPIPGYRYTDLGLPWASASQASAINDAGQVVGWVEKDTHTMAVSWSDGAATLLPSLNAQASRAWDINNSGVIVGASGSRPVRWRGGEVVDLLPADSALYGSVSSVNDAGAMSGHLGTRVSGSPFGSPFSAFTWNPQGISFALPNPASSSTGQSINNSGQVAGYISDPGWSNHNPPTTRPATWMPEYSIQPGENWGAVAHDINDRGQFVGTTGSQSGNPAAFQAMLWGHGTAVVLGPGAAFALNEATQVVGFAVASDGSPLATLWQGGMAIDLNTVAAAAGLPAGWVLRNALDINESGAIVGIATQTGTGLTHAYLLSPVPEPAAWALLLAGLAVLGLAGLQRR